ncbi:MAG: DUF4097 family beta strand repeat-containing protein [Terriglobia bacterium]
MSSYYYRRGSFFWALILIAVGIVFLEQNFNPKVHPWHILARYWPVLIIIWGLSKLIDFIVARMHPQTVAPPLFSGTEVILLLLVLILGTVISRVVLSPWQQWRTELGIHWDPWDNPFVRSYTYTQTLTHQVTGKSQLVVANQRGDVMLEGADTPAVSAVVKETIRAQNQEDANRIFKQINIKMAATNAREEIQPNLDALPDGGANVRLDWTIRAPVATAAQISTDHGDILVSGLEGAQDLTSNGGDVHASGLKGLVRVEKSGGATEVRQVTGDVDVSGSGGDVEIADVSGAVTIQGEFTGSVRFANLAHGVHFKSSRTDLTAGKLPGEVSMEMGSIEVARLDGPLQVATRQKDISIRDFRQSVTISDENGNISLQPAGSPAYPIEVNARKGDIVLNLPSSSHFTLDASSQHGQVSSDFNAPGLAVSTQGDQPYIKGVLGSGGPEIRLNTTYGTIHLVREDSAAPGAASKDATQVQLMTPAVHSRHSNWRRVYRGVVE